MESARARKSLGRRTQPFRRPEQELQAEQGTARDEAQQLGLKHEALAKQHAELEQKLDDGKREQHELMARLEGLTRD